jgi:hypothetical protein
VRIEGLELRVQIDLLVDRIGEAAEAGAKVLVAAGGEDVELICFFQVAQCNTRPVECFLYDLFAIQLAAFD